MGCVCVGCEMSVLWAEGWEFHDVCAITREFFMISLAAQKSALMERVSHQVIVMQYILELAKQLDRDPRSCVPGFFERYVRT